MLGLSDSQMLLVIYAVEFAIENGFVEELPEHDYSLLEDAVDILKCTPCT